MNTSPSSSGIHLRVDAVSIAFRHRRVLTDVSFVASSGERIGLIGENGSGKSTLLRIAAGIQTPDTGSVAIAGSRYAAKVGLLHQDAPFKPSDSIDTALETAVAAARAAVKDIDIYAEELAAHPDDVERSSAYATALERADYLNAWDVDTRISTTLAGIGLDSLERRRRVDMLSGGQRARLALAWTLLSAPDVLLLDEPTNHLDDHAVEYLIRVLRAWKGPVLVASHDRAFLNTAVTGLLDLDAKPLPHAVTAGSDDGSGSGFGVTRFTGNYVEYLTLRANERERWERQYRDEQAELKKLRAGVRENQQVGHADWKPRSEVRMAQKFYADRNAKVVARRVNDTRSRLESLAKRQVRKPPNTLQFTGLTSAGFPMSVPDRAAIAVAAHEISVVGRLAPVSFTVRTGEKLLITGANGSGKSTLLKVIARELPADDGVLMLQPGHTVGLLQQEVAHAPWNEATNLTTAKEAYRSAVGSELASEIPLATFGLLHPQDEYRPVTHLSLGQVRRLQLAIILADPPEILLLDEPTNHLSLPLVSALEKAVPEYPGSVIIASHDRWLRDEWKGRIITIS